MVPWILRAIVHSVAILSLTLPYAIEAASEQPAAATDLPSCQSQLSLETCTKIGQMLIVGFGGLQQDEKGNILWQDPNHLIFNENSLIAREIKHQHIGGVILFTRPFRNKATGAYIRDRNIQNPEQTQKLIRALQNYSARTRKEAKLEALPLFISIDQEGGMIDRLPKDLGFTQTTLIPQALGANEEQAISIQSKNPGSADEKIKMDEKTRTDEKIKAIAFTKQYADQMASQLKDLHFNLNFAPCVDLNLNPINFVLGGRGRSFSANPEIVIDQASAFIQAFHDKNIIATLKHFPGHGSSLEDSHAGMVNVTESYERQKELIPYQTLIQKGYQDIVMTAHVINGQIDKTQCKSGDANDPSTWCPGTLSYVTITKILREQLGFKGVVVSDDMTMGAIAQEYPLEIALEKALNAGVDMFIFANNYSNESEKAIDTLAKLIKAGKVSEKRIDEAYDRIVTLKHRLEKSK